MRYQVTVSFRNNIVVDGKPNARLVYDNVTNVDFSDRMFTVATNPPDGPRLWVHYPHDVIAQVVQEEIP